MTMNEILLEKKLTTDFTFGFELEGLAYDMQNIYDPNCRIRRYITSKIGNGGDFHRDSSIDADTDCVEYIIDSDEEETYYYNGMNVDLDFIDTELGGFEYAPFQTAFEYASPVLKFNLENIQKVINLLDDGIDKEEFTTNKTCGFHHHLSWEGITGEEVAWIVSHLALDTKGRELFSSFIDDENETTSFITFWSDDKYLDKLNNAIQAFDFAEIKVLLNTNKYSLLNVHRNKTLEWRGPRNFLESNNRKTIVRFYKQLWKIVNWMTEVLDRKQINGMDKDIFLKNLIINGDTQPIANFPEFKLDDNGLISDATLAKVIEKIDANPTVLITLCRNKRTLDQVIQKLFNTSKLGKTLQALSSKASIYPQVINDIAYKYIPAKMAKLVSEDAVYNTSAKTLTRLLATRYGVSQDELKEIITNLVPKMNIESLKKYNENGTVIFPNIVRSTDYKLLDYLYPHMSDEQKEQIGMSYFIHLRNRPQEADEHTLDVIFNESNDSQKEFFGSYLGSIIYANPVVIKYIDNVDENVLLSILGRAMRDNRLEETKEILLKSGKVSKTTIAELESYFTKYYKHDLDDEVTEI